MKIATTLIVVTLAVVGSNTSQDPALASQVGSAVVISESKIKELKGHDKTLASRSSKIKVSRNRPNEVSIKIVLGKPTSNKIYAKWYIQEKHKWGKKQFTCLSNLWTHESGWNHLAENPSSGAYGIPQSLPANKMASEGKDWKTNPATQIKWGVKYIKVRYGSPCDAYAHFKLKNWY
jgi:hypothetical protein